VESEMVPLWHHSQEPFLVPEGTFIFLCVPLRAEQNGNLADFFGYSMIEKHFLCA